MSEIVNLRKVRKRTQRRNEDLQAAKNRVLYGRSKAERDLARSRSDKARRELDAHRVETEDGQ